MTPGSKRTHVQSSSDIAVSASDVSLTDGLKSTNTTSLSLIRISTGSVITPGSKMAYATSSVSNSSVISTGGFKSTSTAYSSTPCRSSRASHTVVVGVNATSTFYPHAVNAAVGDLVFFNFLSTNHTVTQSSREAPCQTRDGFDSGFSFYNPLNQSKIPEQQSVYLVRDSEPAWFFCRQDQPSSHCHSGMVFAINAGDIWPQFYSNAIKNTSFSTPTAYIDQYTTEHVGLYTGATTKVNATTTPIYSSSSMPNPLLMNSPPPTAVSGASKVSILMLCLLISTLFSACFQVQSVSLYPISTSHVLYIVQLSESISVTQSVLKYHS